MKNRNVVLLLALASLWGPSFLFIKIAVGTIPPLTLVAIRLGLAAIFLAAFLRLRRIALPDRFEDWKKFIFMGFIANALPFALISFGEQFADSGAASILNGTTPIFTILIAHYFLEDERLTGSRLLGVMIGFAGILLIFLPELNQWLRGGLGSGQEALGLGAILLGAICYGVAIVYSRRRLRGIPPLVGPTAQMIAAAILITPFSLVVDRPFTLSPSPAALMAAGVLGIFGTALAYLVYYQMLDTAGATFISFVTYLLPPIGVVLGVIFLNESPTLYAIAGMITILMGIVIVNRAQQRAT